MFKRVCFKILCALMLANLALACSALYFENGKCRFVGANLDGDGNWNGRVYVNARDIHKSTDMYNNGTAMGWTSLYGSVTFNLVCREYAQYGMNEAGLVIATVSDPKTAGPSYDGRPEMIGNFWLQYALDICATLDDVKETFDRIRIKPGTDRYFVTDGTGKSMVIEFIDGEVIFYQDEYLPEKIITNQSYMIALEHYVKKTLPPATDAFDNVTTARFVKGANRLHRKYMLKSARIPYIFETLRRIEGSPSSVWRIVFHQTKNKIYFITRDNMRLRHIDMGKLDFKQSSFKEMLDIDVPLEGDLTDSFMPYDQKKDIELYENAMQSLGTDIDSLEIERHVQFLNAFYVW